MFEVLHKVDGARYAVKRIKFSFRSLADLEKAFNKVWVEYFSCHCNNLRCVFFLGDQRSQDPRSHGAHQHCSVSARMVGAGV